MQGFSEIIKSFGEWANLPWWPIAMLVVIAIVWWRTRSLFFLYARLARLVVDSKALRDTRLERFFIDESELTRCSIATGYRARTVDEMRRFLATAAALRVNPIDLAKCGRHVSASGLDSSKVPGRVTLVFIASLLVICLATTCLAVAITASDRAVLGFKGSGTHFFLSPTEAVAIRGGQSVRGVDCARGVFPPRPGRTTTFSGDETKALCDLLQTPEEAATLVRQYLEDQRAFAPIALVMLIALLFLWTELRVGLAAFRMKRRLDDDSDDESSMTVAAAVQV